MLVFHALLLCSEVRQHAAPRQPDDVAHASVPIEVFRAAALGELREVVKWFVVRKEGLHREECSLLAASVACLHRHRHDQLVRGLAHAVRLQARPCRGSWPVNPTREGLHHLSSHPRATTGYSQVAALGGGVI